MRANLLKGNSIGTNDYEQLVLDLPVTEGDDDRNYFDQPALRESERSKVHWKGGTSLRFSEFMILLREALELRREEMAHELKLSRGTVQLLEMEQVTPSGLQSYERKSLRDNLARLYQLYRTARAEAQAVSDQTVKGGNGHN